MIVEKFNIHLTEDYLKYYPLLKRWWFDWGWENPIEPAFLPTRGFIVKQNNEYIYAGFLYATDSKICIIDFIVSCKEKVKNVNRQECLKFLLKEIEAEAYNSSFSAIFTYLHKNKNSANLENIFLEKGFKKSLNKNKDSADMLNFIKNI